MPDKCEIEGCESEAKYIDDMEHLYCEECMETAVREEEGCEYEDFENL